jgi:predicted Zn-dependent peptidase
VILEPVKHTEVVSIGFWQDHGSRDESEAQAGFSHFLEHMVFKGTERRNAYQIAQAIDRVGGYLNAFTEKEVTCFYCTLPAESVELAIEILADMATGAVLDEMEIEKEKSVVINEIKTMEDNPEEKGQQYYLERLWGPHALSRQITGLRHQVESIRRKDLAPAAGQSLAERKAYSAAGQQNLAGAARQVRAGAVVYGNLLPVLQ